MFLIKEKSRLENTQRQLLEHKFDASNVQITIILRSINDINSPQYWTNPSEDNIDFSSWSPTLNWQMNWLK